MGWNHVASIAVVIALSIINISHYVIRYTELMGYAQGIVAMIVYYFLVVQTLVCFVRVCGTSPGRPRELLERGLPSMQSGLTKSGKAMRMCNKCQCFKPDRCHHCSDCQACTLKMDHHCPWVNNCVGFNNYKFFVLFLVNAALACGYTIGLLIYAIVQRPTSDLEGWEISSIVNVALVGLFGIGVFGLMGYHLNLMSTNQTTIEQLKNGNPEEFSLGVTENVRQVLGANVLLWCLPCVWGVSPSYDGVEWSRPEPSENGEPLTSISVETSARSNLEPQAVQAHPAGNGSRSLQPFDHSPGFPPSVPSISGSSYVPAIPGASPGTNGTAAERPGNGVSMLPAVPTAVGDIALVMGSGSNGHGAAASAVMATAKPEGAVTTAADTSSGPLSRLTPGLL